MRESMPQEAPKEIIKIIRDNKGRGVNKRICALCVMHPIFLFIHSMYMCIGITRHTSAAYSAKDSDGFAPNIVQKETLNMLQKELQSGRCGSTFACNVSQLVFSHDHNGGGDGKSRGFFFLKYISSQKNPPENKKQEKRPNI